MNNPLPWAASLPFMPKILLSVALVVFVLFVLAVLWIPPTTSDQTPPPKSKTPPPKSDPPPGPNQNITNSPGAIQGGRDVIIQRGQSKLSRDNCDALAGLMRQGRTSLNNVHVQRASDASRAEAIAVQKEMRGWLEQRLGLAFAEAFMSAKPWSMAPDAFPYRHLGFYQHFHGRLTYLTSIVTRYCG